jgi:hypothetical protein
LGGRRGVRNPQMKDISEVYAKGISDAALCAVARNSIRHLVEADDHFKKQRFASALASAVFSIEECGKLYFVALTGKGNQPHRLKQIFFVAMLKVLMGLGSLSKWQPILKDGLPADAVLSEEQQKDIAEHPEIGTFVEELRAGRLTDPQERLAAFAQAVTKKEQRDGTTARWMPFFEGALHKLRMQATYVDIADSGEQKSDPSMIEASNAKFLCAGALGLLTISFGLMWERLSSLTDEFKQLTLTDDLTGQDTVRQVMQPIINAYNRSKEKEA